MKEISRSNSLKILLLLVQLQLFLLISKLSILMLVLRLILIQLHSILLILMLIPSSLRLSLGLYLSSIFFRLWASWKDFRVLLFRNRWRSCIFLDIVGLVFQTKNVWRMPKMLWMDLLSKMNLLSSGIHHPDQEELRYLKNILWVVLTLMLKLWRS